jgi:hypothetical protein
VFGVTQVKETIMLTHFRHAAVAVGLVLLASTSSAGAQYYGVVTLPVPLTQAQRTIIYRTIIPQGYGRQPIVREQIVTESTGPAVVPGGAVDAYAYAEPYPPAYVDPYPRRYVGPDAYSANALVIGGRVPASTWLAPLPPAVVAEVPAIRPYRYTTFGGRVLLVDPGSGVIVADVTP